MVRSSGRRSAELTSRGTACLRRMGTRICVEFKRRFPFLICFQFGVCVSPMDYSSSASSSHMSSTPPAYIFPVLKAADILQCMFELGMEMSKIELAEPARHKEKLRKVYWHLVRLFSRMLLFLFCSFYESSFSIYMYSSIWNMKLELTCTPMFDFFSVGSVRWQDGGGPPGRGGTPRTQSRHCDEQQLPRTSFHRNLFRARLLLGTPSIAHRVWLRPVFVERFVCARAETIPSYSLGTFESGQVSGRATESVCRIE
jgi:hypothetical protein